MFVSKYWYHAVLCMAGVKMRENNMFVFYTVPTTEINTKVYTQKYLVLVDISIA